MSDDPLEIQVNVKIKAPKGKRKLITKKLMQQAIERWAYTGQQSKWIEIRAIHWINPVRADASLAVWKVATAHDVTPEEYRRLQIPGEALTGETLENARGTLHLENMPPSGFSRSVRIVEIREPAKPRRKRKARGKKNAGKRKGKVSKVRRDKGKGSTEPSFSRPGPKIKKKKGKGKKKRA